ncbi:MAG: class I SAM-dependent methyltransferase [Betaproteobacteria bacterium]
MTPCRICGEAVATETLEVPELMLGWRESHRYFRCSACGCLQIETIPDDMARYYGEGYYSYALNAAGGWRGRLAACRDHHLVFGGGIVGALLARAQPISLFDSLQPLRSWLRPGLRVLDVGCGSGGLVQRLRRIGLDAHGADPFIKADIHDGGSLLVRRAQLDGLDERFDLIMFHHSFEHMPDAAGTLRAAAARLATGGRLLVRVPLCSSEAFERYREHWVQLDAPRHFYLHTEASLVGLAQRCGFACEQVLYDSTAFQFWGSEQYRQGLPLRDAKSHAVDPASSPFTPAQIKAWEVRSRALNAARRGDQAAFYLRLST